MPTTNTPIVQGIMISEAAIIVENAFRNVLGMNDNDIPKVSLDHKLGKYADQARIGAILRYVLENRNGGLPSMRPPRTIHTNALTGFTTDSTLRLLIKRVSDYSFYFVKL